MRQTGVQLIKALSALFPRQSPVVWSVRRHGGRIAITFDDGPTDITPQILECLAQYGARATFFLVVNQVSKRPEVIRQILARGHEVGIHGYEHSTRDYYSQIKQSKEELAVYGVVPSIVRTPGGKIKPLLAMRLWCRGNPTVLFSFDAHDSMRLEGKWSGLDPDYSKIKGGDIVLMHDDNFLALHELPFLLESIANKNLCTVTVSELMRPRLLAPFSHGKRRTSS